MSNLMLQCLLGVQCQDFAMIAVDQTATQSVVIMKNDENKIHKLSKDLVMGVNGDAGDSVQFAQYVAKNLALYSMRNGYDLSPAAAVHFIRRNLAEGLRGGNPYMVNSLIAGYDSELGGQLYYMDFMSTCIRVPYAAHGFGGLFSVGILDRYHKPTMTEGEAYELMKKCVKEIQERLFVHLPNFQVVAINKNGMEMLPIIKGSEMR